MMKLMPMVLVVAAMIALSVWWKVYAYGDCRHVGHSRLYCIMSIGRS